MPTNFTGLPANSDALTLVIDLTINASVSSSSSIGKGRPGTAFTSPNWQKAAAHKACFHQPEFSRCYLTDLFLCV